MAFKTFTSGAVLTAAEINTYLMQQSVIVCTSATRPSSPVEGMRIAETDTDLEYIYTGSAWIQVGNFGAFTTYTPTLTQSGAITKTVDHAAYQRHGRWISGNVKLTATGSGTSNNQIIVGLPTAALITINEAVGSGFWYDLSTTTYGGFVAVIATSTTVALLDTTQPLSSSPFYGVTGSSNNNAVDTGDIITLCFSYEAAA